MALAAGTRLGPYEILAPLGVGGMGEVYRAKDTKLDRDVAIKVLPTQLTGDVEALDRLEREARAVAALSHPNILTIHDFGESSGLSFAVMELLEGETLRERLKAGALSVRKVVEFGAQMASGLAAAHDKGIVHRDLKPENVFLTRDGRVKILDFGLAREGVLRSSDDPASAPTLRSHTVRGTVLGTVGYMSPEQARGEQADQRSDIFSLGCVLYEMISGRRAFHRETAVETMTAILREEPAEATASGLQIPPELDRVVRHCLEKRADERFQSARDLTFALQAVSSSGSSAGWASAGGRSRRDRVLRTIAVGLAIVTTLGVGTLVGRRFAAAPPLAFHQLTFNRGVVRSARFSPDGQTFVYGAAWNGRPYEVYSTRIDGVGSRSFGLPPGDVLGVSDTGDMALLMGRLTYLMGTGTLARSHLSGGAQREILDDVRDGDLANDGSDLAIVRRVDGRDRLEFPIGAVLFSTEGWVQHPRVSADRTRVAFLEHPMIGDDRGFVTVVDRRGRATRLTKEWAAVEGLAWSADGQEVWFTAEIGGEGTCLRAVSLSGTGRVVFAAPVQLQLQDINRNGQVLLVANRNTAELIGHARGEAGEHILDLFGQLFMAGLSDDGGLLAFTYVGPLSGADYSVYVAQMNGTPPVRLGDGSASSISPDGKWILASLPSAPERLMLLPTGRGEPRELDLGDVRLSNNPELPQSWTQDSRKFLFAGSERGRSPRAYLLDLSGGKPRAVTPEDSTYALLEPDGRSVLARGDGGNFFLFPVAGGAALAVKGIAEGELPFQFDASGEAVYVWNGVFPARVDRLSLVTGRRESWRTIMPPDPAGVENGTIAVTPDGSTYVYRYRRLQSELFVVFGLR